MQKCEHFCAALASLLVLEATDRRCNVHALGPQESVIAVLGQRHGEGVVAIKIVDIRFYDSCGTPEGRYVAQLMEGAALEAGARWESGKAVGVRAVAIVRPSAGGFEGCSGDISPADIGEQGFELRLARQVPAFRANAPDHGRR